MSHCAARIPTILFCVIAQALTVVSPLRAQPQVSNDPNELKRNSDALVREKRYLEAAPLLEQLIKLGVADAGTHFNLGFGLVAEAATTSDSAKRAALRIRARNEFIQAKVLGEKAPITDAMIEGLPADGSDAKPFSENKAANDLMNGAEALFSQGKMDEALAAYQKSLEMDPKLYHAALFSGDVYMHLGNFDQAEVWYQKAIAIDPTKEVGYRYSATPLMKQQKYDLARDRYVEAYIREPYNKFAIAGLMQWGQVTKTQIGNPQINIPTDVSFDEKGNANVKLDASALLGGKNDGSFAWIVYGGTRSIWRKEKFAKTFPQEKQYRHSLEEETEALRGVLSMATKDKKVKQLSPSLAKLKQLNDKGLLESYILLARADEGISADYPDYLAHNHDKLSQYVMEYVLTNGRK